MAIFMLVCLCSFYVVGASFSLLFFLYIVNFFLFLCLLPLRFVNASAAVVQMPPFSFFFSFFTLDVAKHSAWSDLA